MEQANEKSHSEQSAKDEKGRNAKDRLKNVFYVLGLFISVVIGIQNYYLGLRQNDINERQNDINHRLDVKDAWQRKGLTGAIDKNATAAITERERNEKIIAHCKSNPCNLPIELSVLSAGFKIISAEEVLIKEQ